MRPRSTRLIFKCFLLALMIFSLLIAGFECPGRIEATIVNNSDVPIWGIEVNDDGFGNGLRPGERLTMLVARQALPGTWPGGPTQPPPYYVVKAYEFVPGKGDLHGWFDENGRLVKGSIGELVFTKTYTWKELERMKFTFIITRNVLPGSQPESAR